MARHLYFLPMITEQNGEMTVRAPKYIWGPFIVTGTVRCQHSVIDPEIGICVVLADTTIEDHQMLFDAPDCLSVDPRNGNRRDLDDNATEPEIAALSNYLEASSVLIPMNWAETTHTRRAILRRIITIMRVYGHLTAVAGQPVAQWNIPLNRTWGELSQEHRDIIIAAAGRARLSHIAVPPDDMTLRQVLVQFARRMPDKQYFQGDGAI